MIATRVADPVEPLDRTRLGVQVDRLGRGRLHPVGQLVTLDPRRQLGLGGEVLGMNLVRLSQKGQLRPLFLVSHSGGTFEIVNRRSLRVEVRPLVRAWQKSGAPVRRMPLGQSPALGIAHHHEPRQVVGLAAQSVRDPRAKAREAHARHPRVDHEQGRRMVVRFGENRMQERHLVDVPAQVREDLRDHLARAAAGREPEWRLHERADLVLEEAGRVLERWVELAHRLAVPALEGGLKFPGVDLAGPAVGEDPDDPFGPSGKCPGRAAMGLSDASAAAVGASSRPSPSSKDARPIRPNPPPARWSHRRRLSSKCESLAKEGIMADPGAFLFKEYK